jgi:hypothetical protein
LSQLDLLVSEWSRLRTNQYNDITGFALALERHRESGAKPRYSLTLGKGVFRIGLYISNLNCLAGKQDPSDNRAPPRHKWGSLGDFFKFPG